MMWVFASVVHYGCIQAIFDHEEVEVVGRSKSQQVYIKISYYSYAGSGVFIKYFTDCYLQVADEGFSVSTWVAVYINDGMRGIVLLFVLMYLEYDR